MDFLLFKHVWSILDPGRILYLWLALALVLSALPSTRLRRAGRAGLVAFSVVLLVLSSVPLAGWMNRVLEERFPVVAETPRDIEGVIVLGGFADPDALAERGRLSVPGNADRLLAFIQLAHARPDARLIFTGGSGDPRHPDRIEAAVVKRLLDETGFPTERVLFEDASRNTFENALMTRAMIGADAAQGGCWVLITSARHMPRAAGVFHKAGWSILPFPVGHTGPADGPAGPWFRLGPDLNLLQGVFYEWAGLAAYRARGWTDALLPGLEAVTREKSGSETNQSHTSDCGPAVHMAQKNG